MAIALLRYLRQQPDGAQRLRDGLQQVLPHGLLIMRSQLEAPLADGAAHQDLEMVQLTCGSEGARDSKPDTGFQSAEQRCDALIIGNSR